MKSNIIPGKKAPLLQLDTIEGLLGQQMII